MAIRRHFSSNPSTYPCEFSTDPPIATSDQNLFIGLVWHILGSQKRLRCEELAKNADARLGHNSQGSKYRNEECFEEELDKLVSRSNVTWSVTCIQSNFIQSNLSLQRAEITGHI